MPTLRTTQLILEPKEAYKLFRISTDLADTLEDILESHASFSEEFLRGLKMSANQARTGKLKAVNSLTELLTTAFLCASYLLPHNLEKI